MGPEASDGSRPDGTSRNLTAAEWAEAERANLLRASAASGWKISRTGGAAERLGLRPSTLTSQDLEVAVEHHGFAEDRGRAGPLLTRLFRPILTYTCPRSTVARSRSRMAPSSSERTCRRAEPRALEDRVEAMLANWLKRHGFQDEEGPEEEVDGWWTAATNERSGVLHR